VKRADMMMDLDSREYATLVELLHFAMWILTANDHEPVPEKARFRELEQKLLARAADFGCGDLVHYAEEHAEHMPTLAVEQACDPYIQEYDNDTFWQELIIRLAERDFMRDADDDEPAPVDVVEIHERLAPYQERYAQEFEANGLETLEVVPRRDSRVTLH
jgi:hypothetical protein